MLEVDRLRIIADLTNSAGDRARAEQEALRAERAAFDRQTALDADMTDAQRADLAAARDAADAQRARAIEIHRMEGLAREQADKEASDNAGQQDLVAARGRVNDRTTAQRRMTDMRLIDLEFSEREAQATREYDDAVRRGDEVAERTAFARLARLEELKALAKAEAQLANQSPMERLRDELDQTAEEMSESLEMVQVRGLRALEDGLVDSIVQAKSLGDVFSNMADQIIADLARIAIQQAVIRPLGVSLAGKAGHQPLVGTFRPWSITA